MPQPFKGTEAFLALRAYASAIEDASNAVGPAMLEPIPRASAARPPKNTPAINLTPSG